MLTHATARPVGDWLAMLDQVDTSIARSLADAERHERECADVHDAAAHKVAAKAKKFQSRLQKRLEELSASLIQASQAAHAAGEELLGAETDVRRWVGSVTELRAKLDALAVTGVSEPGT